MDLVLDIAMALALVFAAEFVANQIVKYLDERGDDDDGGTFA